MKIPVFQVDAFTNKVFGGNPAAVCPLENWIEDRLLQNIARENNLSETAFFVKGPGGEYANSGVNAKSGEYPVVRPLNMMTNGEPEGATAGWMDFVLSDAGQAIVEEEGYLAVK